MASSEGRINTCPHCNNCSLSFWREGEALWKCIFFKNKEWKNFQTVIQSSAACRVEWRACREEWKSKFYSSTFLIGMASTAFAGDGLWVSLFCAYAVLTSFLISRVWVKKSRANTHWWKALSVHRRELHQILQDFRRPAEAHSDPHRY